jgi:hypothetical protein
LREAALGILLKQAHMIERDITNNLVTEAEGGQMMDELSQRAEKL